MYACTTPVSAITMTDARASGEKRTSVASRSGVRWAGCSARVAAGSANTIVAMPPTQRLAAATCSTSTGKNTATGDWMLACPASAGVITR